MRRRVGKKLAKAKQEKTNKLNGFLLLGGILLLVTVALYGPKLFNRTNQSEIIASQHIGKNIPLNKVCMVRGDIKAKDTHMLRIGDKVYFGCCQKCLSKLKNNVNNVQYASDPATGKMINKAEALIKLNPINSNKVLFFESQETYDQYLKLILNE
ncbi:TRASH domain-containing protein [Marinifilum sp.]|uniref:TRASH domain-containing protein n=1 Tax=Marinifilum sp. TaxID=2033137 RepID=UPI003BAD7999